MAKSAYPTLLDLEDYLLGAGFTVGQVAPLDLKTAIASGIREFEARVDRTMLAPAATSIRYYDPPTNGDVVFVEDCASAPTVEIVPQGGTAEALTAGTDYTTEPVNAIAKGQPVTMLRFLVRTWCYPLPPSARQSVKVTAKHGYCLTLPDDAWSAMLARGAEIVLPRLVRTISSALRGGVVEWQEGDVRKKYGSNPAADLRSLAKEQWDRGVCAYERIAL